MIGYKGTIIMNEREIEREEREEGSGLHEEETNPRRRKCRL